MEATHGSASATRGQGCNGPRVGRHPAASLWGRGGVICAWGVMGSQSCNGVHMPVLRRCLLSITTTVGPGQPTWRLEHRCSSQCKLNLNLPAGDNSPHISAPVSSSYPSNGLMYVDSPMDQSISQGMSLDSHISNDNWLFFLSIASLSSTQASTTQLGEMIDNEIANGVFFTIYEAQAAKDNQIPPTPIHAHSRSVSPRCSQSLTRLTEPNDPNQHDEQGHQDSNPANSISSCEATLLSILHGSAAIIEWELLAISPLSEWPPPFESYTMSHNKWYIHAILLLATYFHTKHHMTFQASNIMLYTLWLIFNSLGLLNPDIDMPTTLITTLKHLNIEDCFTVIVACPKCHWHYAPNTPITMACLNCEVPLFTAPSHTLFQRLLGHEPPPPLKMSIPVAPLSQQLSNFLACPGIEKIVEDWHERKVIPGELNCIMDGWVWKEILGPDGKPFFDKESLTEPGELCLGVTYTMDW